jgi:DNA-binding winged helix-turn-helix (wHTH) protein/tetratricopeptide (TPR) repeat protein
VILAFGDAELDLDRYELHRGGVRVPIEPQVFDVLVHLVSNAHRVVSKEELLDTVWGDRFVSESALTSRIKAARRAVGDDGRRQGVIATAHGRGYRVVVPVDERPTSDRIASASLPRSGDGQARPLLEREEPMAALTGALAAARTGSGRLVCVAGEAGIGKSTLVRTFADDLAGAAPVLIAGCDDLSTPRPLGAIKDLVDQLPDGLRGELPGDLGVTDVAGLLATLGAGRGCAAVVEDVHWADDATLDVIRQLAPRVRDLPVVLVVTYRDEDVELSHPLRRLLGSIRGPHVAHLRLEPLGKASVATLASRSGRDPGEVFATTGGNPLFVTELISAPPGRLPSSIKDAVVSRLAELPTDDAEVVRKIAVVPVRVERALIEVLCGSCEDSLAAAERRGILTGDVSHIWFRHELVRQAVEDTLVSSERVRLHRQLARYLHDHGADAARVVHHATRCDDTELLLTAGPIAAREASAAGAHRQAVQHLDVVLRHAARLPAGARAELLTLRTHSLYLLNRFDASLTCAAEAVSVSRQVDDREQLARALIAYARTGLWAVGPDAAREAIEQALAVLGDGGDLELRTTAHADLSRAVGELATVGSVAQANPMALEHAERALRLAERLDRSDLRGYALMYLGSARLAAGDTDGSDDAEQAIRLLTTSPRADLAVRACVNASGAAYRAGRFDQAERYVEHGLRLTKGAEFFSGEYRLGLTRAAVRVSRGHWPEAESELRALVGADGEPGIMEPLAQCLLARLLARRGQCDEARALVASARRATQGSGEARVLGPVAIAAVEVGWLTGAAASLTDLADLARPVLDIAARGGNHTIAAELGRYLQWTGLGAPPIAAPPEPWASGLRGDWRAAAAQWQRRGEPYEEALELLSGDQRDASGRGLEILRRLGAAGAIEAVGRGRVELDDARMP